MKNFRRSYFEGEKTAYWKKRSTEESQVDFETMETIISDIMDTFETDTVDFTKQFKIAFTCSLDGEGCVRIDEFGFLGEELKKKMDSEPLVEVIEFKTEILAVVDATNLPRKDIDFKISANSLLLSEKGSKKSLKRIEFPCNVNEESVRASFNNGVLEIRVAKKKSPEKKVMSAK
ncbi:MAG TPA: Hsp20/alpha crystallin family protein [archaeon]|nr:Hsp20/alpha crystallin family protein [archaeon]